MIKLVGHPYKDYKVGDIVDLGEEKNKSMVAIQRAVFVGGEKKEKKKKSKKSKKK